MRIRNVIVGPLRTNCYLIYKDEEMVVVDPGAEAEKIVEVIRELGISPKFIINTHSHYDHTMANKKVAKETGAVLKTDLKEGDVISIGSGHLKVIETPGHTTDSICFLADDFLIAGDVLFSDGRGRTDLPGGSLEEMRETVNRLKEIIPPKMIVYSGHGESFIAKDHYLLSGRKEI